MRACMVCAYLRQSCNGRMSGLIDQDYWHRSSLRTLPAGSGLGVGAVSGHGQPVVYRQDVGAEWGSVLAHRESTAVSDCKNKMQP